VGNIAGGVPAITGPDLTGLISDRELEATREQKAELLVGMMVYLIDRPSWVNGTDQVHVFTRDDLPSDPFVIPTDRVYLIPGKYLLLRALDPMFVQPSIIHT